MYILLSFFYITFHLLLGLFVAFMGGGACFIALQRLQLTVFSPRFHPRRSGRMIAKGIACATDPDEIQTTPLSLTPCIAYNFSILEPQSRVKGRVSLAVLHSQSRGQWNLSVQTPRGQVQVKPHELDLNHIHFQDKQDLLRKFAESRSSSLLTEQGITAKNTLTGLRRTLILREEIIRNRDVIRVMGRQNINNPLPVLEEAIVTDKTFSKVIWESSFALVVGFFFFGIALSIIKHAFS